MDRQLGDYFFLTCFDIARLSAGRFVQPPENETGLTTRLAAIVKVKQIHPVTATRVIRFSVVLFFVRIARAVSDIMDFVNWILLSLGGICFALIFFLLWLGSGK